MRREKAVESVSRQARGESAPESREIAALSPRVEPVAQHAVGGSAPESRKIAALSGEKLLWHAGVLLQVGYVGAVVSGKVVIFEN